MPSSSTALRQVEPTWLTSPFGDHGRPAELETYGPAVADLLHAADFGPDPQQELVLDLVFAVNEVGLPASFATWVIAARQNLKTGSFIQIAIGWIYVMNVREVLWTAHEAKTAADSMESFAEVVQHPALSRLLPQTKNRGKFEENGDERVEFSTEQVVGFRTRTKNGARGIARTKKVILDEAFALTNRQTGAIMPAVAAKKGEGQIVGGSSAGPIEADYLRGRRDLLRTYRPDQRATWVEWAAPFEPCELVDCQHPKDALERGIDCALDREHLQIAGNPATVNTDRMTLQTIKDLRQELPPEEFARECFGWWDEPDETGAVIPSRSWNAVADETSKIAGRKTFGLEVSEDHEWAAIAVAGKRIDERVHVEITSQQLVGIEGRLVDYRPGVEWVVERAVELHKRWHARFAIASGSAAMSLKPELEAAKVPVDVVKHGDVVAACGYFVDLVKNDNLRHLGQTPLNLAVSDARKRNVGDGAWAFGRRVSSGDITALYAAVIAAWQTQTARPRPADLTNTFH